ncbi:Herpes-BLLF1 domain containing protein [Pyrenophora tritici-repentis]|nr:Herpes-BLLF1 domain containing protein [Pyrenophora tritici-repentis]KAI1527928.1 Herpes-BLLF1 domain containing protein [Pyrenophora tritici-repentis]KAI1537289.1 Herpes-BLLF1 domain containing protein [Pyrenophora tritici-repentis]KAI1560835.1 Herpes-BLLF1 domain containing protein [Pyrenophora tritici-repentis]KAI1566764.1 Herpes-BLLF1 domain containing protein [Pyrenophora tritici-repentis]
MKGVFAFASFVAIAIAADPKLSKAKPSISLNPLARRNYAATYYSTPPEPTDSYPVSSVIEIPPPQPTECLDTDPDPCSTVLITVTSIHTISVSHVPSSLISEPPTTSDQSSATVPPESAPATETEKSSTAAPEESTVGTTTDIQTETELSTSLPSDITLSISIIEGSSVAPPEAPFPTATDEPTQTSATGTGSYTASPTLPEFTAAADAVRVPAVVVGVLGWAALMM